MLSQEGERIQALKVVDVNDGEKKGNIEKWLSELEVIMR